MTEVLNHFSRVGEVVGLVPLSDGDLRPDPEPGSGPWDGRPGSADGPTEQVFLLRERMTLLRSQVELAQSQLSTMRSGRASRDLYVRVFLPLMHELEETSKRYEAVAGTNARRRQRERPASAVRPHRRSIRPPLHRFMNLSG